MSQKLGRENIFRQTSLLYGEVVHRRFPLGGIVGPTNLILDPPEAEKLMVGMGERVLDHDPPYVANITLSYLKGYSLLLPSDHGQFSCLQTGSQLEEA